MKRPGILLILPMLMAFVVSPLMGQTLRSADTEAPLLPRFGSAVAIDADAIYIAEPRMSGTSGVIYVFERSGDAWEASEKLMPSDGAENNGFGAAMMMDGTSMLVSAPGANDGNGAAYVYAKDSSGSWAEVARLMADDTGGRDAFGMTIAMEGDFAFVAAPMQTGRKGAIYVFHRDGSGAWSMHSKLTASQSKAGARFGTALAVKGNHLFVGAPRESSGAGAVYVFTNTDGTWIETHHLTIEDLGANSRLGSTLAIQGETLYAGAPLVDGATGAVYTFTMDEEASAWTSGTRLVPFASDSQMRFGMTLRATDAGVWVGAPGVAGNRGAVYLYDGMDMSFGGVHFLQPEDIGRNAAFGGTLAVHDNLAVIGAPGSDGGLGSVYVFENSGMRWSEGAMLIGEEEGLDAIVGEKVSCAENKAGDFDCNRVDLLAFLPIDEIGGSRGARLNDIWGWTDPENGKEYALIGRTDGTAFVDISDPSNPIYLGNLERTEGSPTASWRDIKVYNNHAFIVADASGQHGMQVFDLTQLRNVSGDPVEFQETAHYDRIASAHNIVINEETGFAYTVGNSSGGETCGGGLHMIDVRDPMNPTFAGCFSDSETGRSGTGYSHDAQCIVYNGPDTDHQGKEICFGANETALSIADVTEKANPVALSRAAYPNVGYSHQGWITDDHKYFYLNDELDEISGSVEGTRTMIWDVTDLDEPVLLKEFVHESKASDHNLYIDGNLMYQSNYAAGLRIFDITNIENPVEVGYFDTTPGGDNGPGFSGSWSNYPYFPSGTIIATSIGEGFFVLKKNAIDI